MFIHVEPGTHLLHKLEIYSSHNKKAPSCEDPGWSSCRKRSATDFALILIPFLSVLSRNRWSKSLNPACSPQFIVPALIICATAKRSICRKRQHKSTKSILKTTLWSSSAHESGKRSLQAPFGVDLLRERREENERFPSSPLP